MDISWGDAFDDGSAGQDILGIRGLDQAIEQGLVNGLTTVSQRGRYLTILPWAVGAYFAADASARRQLHDPERLQRFLFKIEFLTLAASKLLETPGRNEAFAALGTNNYEREVSMLKAGASVTIPPDKTGGMLATYFGPSQQLGTMLFGEGGEPYRLTPRGQAIWRVRHEALGDALTERILQVDDLSHAMVEEVADHFALQRLSAAQAEAALLREALTSPWPDGSPEPRVSAAYHRFSETIAWLRENATVEGAQAERLLSETWKRAATGNGLQGVQLTWAEYEWRRRLHYALELIFASAASAIRDRGAATVSEVVEDWRGEELPPAVLEVWPEAHLAWERTASEARESVPAEAWLDGAPSSKYASLTGHARAMCAFALFCAVSGQSRTLRQGKLFRDAGGWGEKALAVVDTAGDGAFLECLCTLAEIAVQAHLQTTFRKMAANLPCSLRVFPEGRTLRTTGRDTGAGRSGPRLWNVVRVLRDAGFDGLGGDA